MTMLAPKRPTEVRRYVFDYTRELVDDTITAFQIAVTSGNVIVQSIEIQDDGVAIAFLAGGVNGQTSTFELQMTTASGQLLIRDFSLLTINAFDGAGQLPSSTTKGQIVSMAFEETGLPGYTFDATSAEQASALQRLDSLMAMWAGPGMNLDVGYNFPGAIGGSAMTDVSGVPDLALDAVAIKLALSISPGIGKTLSVETRVRMAESMRATRNAFTVIPTMRLGRSTPRGAGAKPWSTWWPFIGSPGSLEQPQSGLQPSPLPPGTAVITTEDGQIITTESGGSISA